MARGYYTSGDVLTKTVDGVDFNSLWQEFQQTLSIYNEKYDQLINLLAYDVVKPTDAVPIKTDATFEVASEYGVPQAQKPGLTYHQMGYSFDWHDVASRMTFDFLANAESQEILAAHDGIITADKHNLTMSVLRTLFDNRTREASINNQNYNIYPLYNGDGTVPPSYGTNKFDGTYTHYLVSGAATVDSGDLEDIQERFKKLGFGKSNGMTTILLVNSQEMAAIRGFRARSENANGAVAQYDFVPSLGQASFMLPNFTQVLQGSQPPNMLNGIAIAGAYGDLYIAENDYIPAGYMVAFVTGGERNVSNPVGIRHHKREELRGLMLVSGEGDKTYPLVNSYYRRGFGTGIRQRGGAIVMQVTAGTSYTIPEFT